jgi:hypothetical protein
MVKNKEILIFISIILSISSCKKNCPVIKVFPNTHENVNLKYLGCENKGRITEIYKFKSTINLQELIINVQLLNDTLYIGNDLVLMPLFHKNQKKSEILYFNFIKDNKEFRIINNLLDIKYIENDTIYFVQTLCIPILSFSKTNSLSINNNINLNNNSKRFQGLFQSKIPFTITLTSTKYGFLKIIYNDNAININPAINIKM